jgi:hypothetical protein
LLANEAEEVRDIRAGRSLDSQRTADCVGFANAAALQQSLRLQEQRREPVRVAGHVLKSLETIR